MLWFLSMCAAVGAAKITNLANLFDYSVYEEPDETTMYGRQFGTETLEDSTGITSDDIDAGSFLSGSAVDEIVRRRAESLPIPEEYYGECYKWVNIVRAREGLPALRRWREAEGCTAEMTQYDFEGEPQRGSHKGFSEGKFCDFQAMGAIAWAQNTCPNWPNAVSSVAKCTEMMWDEKSDPGVDPNDLSCKSDSKPCGHYYNLRGGSKNNEYNKFDRVACGFYIHPTKKTLSVNTNFGGGRTLEFQCGGDLNTAPAATLITDCSDRGNTYADCAGGRYDFMACDWVDCSPFFESDDCGTDHQLCPRLSVSPGTCGGRRVNFGRGWMNIEDMCRPSCGACKCPDPPAAEPVPEPAPTPEPVQSPTDSPVPSPTATPVEPVPAPVVPAPVADPETAAPVVAPAPDTAAPVVATPEPTPASAPTPEEGPDVVYMRGSSGMKAACPEGFEPILDDDECVLAGLNMNLELKKLPMKAGDTSTPRCIFDANKRKPGFGMSNMKGNKYSPLCQGTETSPGGLQPPDNRPPAADNKDIADRVKLFMTDISDEYCSMYDENMALCEDQSHFCMEDDSTCVPDGSKATLTGAPNQTFMDSLPMCQGNFYKEILAELNTCTAAASELVSEKKQCKGKGDRNMGRLKEPSDCASACSDYPFFRFSRKCSKKNGCLCFCENTNNCKQQNSSSFDLYRVQHVALVTGEEREQLQKKACDCIFDIINDPTLSQCKWDREFVNKNRSGGGIQSIQQVQREYMVALDCFDTELTVKCDSIVESGACNATYGCRMSDNGCTLRGFSVCTQIDNAKECDPGRGCEWFPDGCAEAECDTKTKKQCKKYGSCRWLNSKNSCEAFYV